MEGVLISKHPEASAPRARGRGSITADARCVRLILFDVRLDTLADLGILGTFLTEGVAGDIAPKRIELVTLDQDRVLPWRPTRPAERVSLLMLTNPYLEALILVFLWQARSLNPFRFFLPRVLARHTVSPCSHEPWPIHHGGCMQPLLYKHTSSVASSGGREGG
jgi:hypothetical protein